MSCRIFRTICIVLLSLIMIACGKKDETVIQVSQVNEMTMKTSKEMVQKIVTEEDDIQEILNRVNTLKKRRINMGTLKGGWTTWIQTYDEEGYRINSILFQGKYLNINGEMYRIDESESKKMQEIYDELDYQEVEWEKNWLNDTGKTDQRFKPEYDE